MGKLASPVTRAATLKVTDPVAELKRMYLQLQYCETDFEIQDINYRLLQIFRQNTEYRKIARNQGISTHPWEFNWSSVQHLLANSALKARTTRDHKRAVRMQMISENITQMSSATVRAQRKILGKILKLAKRDDYVVQHGNIAATVVGKKPLIRTGTPLSLISNRSVITHDTENLTPPSLVDDNSAGSCGSCCSWPLRR